MDISEKHVASIIGFESLVTCSSETLGDFQRTTWDYIPEDKILYNRRNENLKSNFSK
jgi:hypothetical protein